MLVTLTATVLAFFLPIPIPYVIKSHGPTRVAPVTHLSAIIDAAGCTSANLGNDVSPESCASLVTHHRGFIARFDWAQKPCGTKNCVEATNFRFDRGGKNATSVFPADRTTLEGPHAFAVEYAADEPVCLNVWAIATPQKLGSEAANVCVYQNAADLKKH